MTRKLNCWQFKNCGRESGGLLAECLGVCPVSVAAKYDGENGGQAGGRVCWKVTGACLRCESAATGLGKPCHECPFYVRVSYEQAGVGLDEKITVVHTAEAHEVSKSS
jgi:hypothetical protein